MDSVSITGTGSGGERRRQPPLGWAGWKAALRDATTEIITDRVSLVSAGCAFYATLALFPAISMLVFTYGLLFDPHTVEPQLETLEQLLPPPAYRLIADRVHLLVAHGVATLSTGLAISTLIALWSSMAGIKAVLQALNLASKQKEERGFFRFQLIALAFTLSTIVGAVLGIAIMVGLPQVLAFVGFGRSQRALLHAGGLAMLISFVAAAISFLYRYGPCRPLPQWHWITPGSLLATVLWVLASELLSFYIGHLASYDAIYGPLAAVIGVMTWFWVSAYVVLLGAELDAARHRLFQQRQSSQRQSPQRQFPPRTEEAAR